jgi:DNA-binding LacI/PurR family transcriptional regulator
VSVVGFDDIPEAAYFNTPLTTIRQDFGEVGRRSLALLLDRIESGGRAAKRHVVETTLVLRDSTASGPRVGRAAGRPAERRTRGTR